MAVFPGLVIADYTHQLDQIARALARPATPPWVQLVATAILSFLAAFVLQPLQHWLLDLRNRKLVRKVLYEDLADIFSAVESIMEFSETEPTSRWEWQREQLRLHVHFRGEPYVRSHQEVYIQLRERSVADNIYTYFHRALDDVDHWWHTNWSTARQMFAHALVNGQLSRKQFRKAKGRDDAKSLFERCEGIHASAHALLASKRDSMGDVGP